MYVSAHIADRGSPQSISCGKWIERINGDLKFTIAIAKNPILILLMKVLPKNFILENFYYHNLREKIVRLSVERLLVTIIKKLFSL